MSRLKQLFKDLGILKREGATEAEIAELEKKIEDVEAGLKEDARKELEGVKAKPGTKGEPGSKGEPGEKGEPGKLDPETQKLIDDMKSEMEGYKKRLDERDEAEKSAAEKAQTEAYTAYVNQLAKDGKITRARKDELLKEEMVKANAPALETFKTATADLKPDPKIATENNQPGEQKKDEPKKDAQPVDTSPRPLGAAVDVDKTVEAAKAEAAAFL